MLIALFPNEKKKHSFDLASQIRQFFNERGITVVAEDEKAKKIGASPLSQIDPKNIHFMISMGGDGTMLRIAHRFSMIDAPILGINLGHLGFMADVPAKEIFPSLEDLLAGKFSIDERMMLEGLGPDKASLQAVNDIVLHRGQNYSLIELSIHLDGVYVNTFVADGIIIATPNGSTAYSLAAGGPILSPDLDAIVMTPICPHTLSNRPVILPRGYTVEVRIGTPCREVHVSLDGQPAQPMRVDERIIIQLGPAKLRFIHSARQTFPHVLREKLHWRGDLKPARQAEREGAWPR